MSRVIRTQIDGVLRLLFIPPLKGGFTGRLSKGHSVLTDFRYSD
ncbi:hypothetical protein X971_2781 [Agrobacterium tumefaciens LBA4213 (Ach5)]|jgi:hypothetical protein|nr:hypothetical protein X971_2781 [Agrobacterium tumefaciens LBA4213 (Ach5)]